MDNDSTGYTERAFEHKDFGVLRTYEKDGEVLFNLEDVSRNLGLTENEVIEILNGGNAND